jgi:hypothetical protein
MKLFSQWMLAVFFLATMFFANAELLAQIEISSISPPGLQIGQTTTVVMRGKNLFGDSKILAPFPVSVQSVNASENADQASIVIELPEKVVPGISYIRVQNKLGISKPIAIALDQLQQTAVAELNEPIDPCGPPKAVFGTVESSAMIQIDLKPTASETVFFEVESVRLGTQFKPVLRVLDQDGNQLAWAHPQRHLGGDTRLAVALEAGKTYRLEMADQLRRAAANSFFRLKTGQFHFVDLVTPVFTSPQKLIGTNMADDQKYPDLLARNSETLNWRPISFISVKNFSGTRPTRVYWPGQLLDLTDHTEVVDVRLHAVPIAVSAILNSQTKSHSYVLPVTVGQKVRFEMFAERIGSTLDGVLTIYDLANNKLLQQADDFQRTSDPVLDFTVPAGVENLRFEIRDVTGASGEDFLYGITVQDISSGTFELTFDQPNVSLEPGQRALLKLVPRRNGYNGPIQLQLIGASDNLRFNSPPILPGSNQGLVTLENIGPERFDGVPFYVQASTEDRTFQTIAKNTNDYGIFRQSWLDRQIAVAPTVGNGIQLVANWPDTFDRSKPITIFRGGGTNVTLQVNAVFPEAYQGNRNIRLERHANMLPSAEAKPQSEQALNFAPNVEASEFMPGEANFRITSHPTTKPGTYQLALEAKLDDKAQKPTILASTFAPIVEVVVEDGIALKITPGTHLIPGQKQSMLHISGTVEVSAKIQNEVTIEYLGPKMQNANATIKVKPGEKTFKLEVPVPSDVSLDKFAESTLRASVFAESDANVLMAATPAVPLFTGTK